VNAASPRTLTLAPVGPGCLGASIRFIEAFTPAALGRREPEVVASNLARVLSTDVDGSGFAAIGERDAQVSQLQKRYAGLRPVGFWSPYQGAVWTIFSQGVRISPGCGIEATDHRPVRRDARTRRAALGRIPWPLAVTVACSRRLRARCQDGTTAPHRRGGSRGAAGFARAPRRLTTSSDGRRMSVGEPGRSAAPGHRDSSPSPVGLANCCWLVDRAPTPPGATRSCRVRPLTRVSLVLGAKPGRLAGFSGSGSWATTSCVLWSYPMHNIQ
jgi:hypothetical protein